MSDYPVGKAQAQVLNALGVQRRSFDGAEAYFAEIGIVVTSRREGRTSVPVVQLKSRYAGGFTADGDGEEWQAYGDLTAEQMQALAPWLVRS